MAIKHRKPSKKRSNTLKTMTLSPLRVTEEEKRTIYEAAALTGQTISQFIINNILTTSQDIINNKKLSPLLRTGRFQLKTDEDAKDFSYIQMKIEDPNITPDYLFKKS